MAVYDYYFNQSDIHYGTLDVGGVSAPILYVKLNNDPDLSDVIRIYMNEDVDITTSTLGACVWSSATYPAEFSTYSGTLDTLNIRSVVDSSNSRVSLTVGTFTGSVTASLGSGESISGACALFIVNSSGVIIKMTQIAIKINVTYYQPNFFVTSGKTAFRNTPTSISVGGLSQGNIDEGIILSRAFTPEPTDPYSGAGDSETGGGDGTFNGTSDPIPIPTLPTVGATDAGFITLYAPTTSQLKNLAYTCWVGLLDDVWTNFRKLFSDPMDCILGLSVVPVSVPTSGTQDVAIGNIPTGVSMNVASQQYIEVDCGSVSFANGYFGSYLDYEPYTKIAIYLPYIGVHQLNTDDIMGRTIQVVYHIDILTGSCIAFVKCGESVLYQFNGACASNIPVNSLNYASTIENAIRIAVNIGTTVATAGASAPLSVGEGVGAGVKTAQNVARGVSMAGATAEGALSMKPSIGRSGSLGGTTGLMGTQYPYMIITRPKLCKPKNQDFYKGYPSFIQTTIGDLLGQGYTEFDTVIISTLYLTDDEEAELETILKGGVYL